MKVLLIHHFETMWAEGYARFGFSFEQLGMMLIKHIRRAKYDRVILTRFEDNKLEDAHYDLQFDKYIDEVQEYAYGWEKNSFQPEDEHITWVEGGNHSEAVYLPGFLYTLRGLRATVKLCGAFDGECIEDMEIALSAMGIPYKRLEKLIVGQTLIS